MATALAFLVALLGAALSHWSHAGIEQGDHERRAWARAAGPIAVAIAAVGWVLATILGGSQ